MSLSSIASGVLEQPASVYHWYREERPIELDVLDARVQEMGVMIRVNTTGFHSGRHGIDPCSRDRLSRLNMVGLITTINTQLIMTINTQDISTETLLKLLAHPRRRAVLHHLQGSGGDAVPLDELVETTAPDGGREMARYSTEDAHAEVELHHLHLPKLAEAGVVECDAHEETIRYHSNDQVEKLLHFVSTQLE